MRNGAFGVLVTLLFATNTMSYPMYVQCGKDYFTSTQMGFPSIPSEDGTNANAMTAGAGGTRVVVNNIPESSVGWIAWVTGGELSFVSDESGTVSPEQSCPTTLYSVARGTGAMTFLVTGDPQEVVFGFGYVRDSGRRQIQTVRAEFSLGSGSDSGSDSGSEAEDVGEAPVGRCGADDDSWSDWKYGRGGTYCADMHDNPEWCTHYGVYSAEARQACPAACGLCNGDRAGGRGRRLQRYRGRPQRRTSRGTTWTADSLAAASSNNARRCYVAFCTGGSEGQVYKISEDWYTSHSGGGFGDKHGGRGSCGRVINDWFGKSGAHGQYRRALDAGRDLQAGSTVYATYEGAFTCA